MFKISFSTNTMECILRFWNVMESVDFPKKKVNKEKANPKSQDVYHNICRGKDSEHNKKHCSSFKIVGLIIVLKLRFLLIICCLCIKSEIFQEQMWLKFYFNI